MVSYDVGEFLYKTVSLLPVLVSVVSSGEMEEIQIAHGK